MLSCYQHHLSQVSPSNKTKQAADQELNKDRMKKNRSSEQKPSRGAAATTKLDRFCSRFSALSRKCTAGSLHISRRPNGATVKPLEAHHTTTTTSGGILRKRTGSTATTATNSSDYEEENVPLRVARTRKREKRSRYVILKNAVRAKADLKPPQESLFQQQQQQQRRCYLDPVQVYCCDSIETTIRTSSAVRFEETVEMIEIPKHRDYNRSVRKALWYSKEEREHILCLSLREFFYEECNWENAIEEDEFIVDEISGVQLHPAHVCSEAEYKRKSAQTEHKYFERIQRYKEQFRTSTTTSSTEKRKHNQRRSV